MRRACNACGTSYEAKSPKSKFCSDNCRLRAHRNPRLAKVTPITAPPAEDAAPAAAVPSVLSRTAARIEALGLEDDPTAAVALVLARRLDSDAETGAAVASLAKQYAVVMDDLRKRGKRAADPLDELRERMMSKARGA